MERKLRIGVFGGARGNSMIQVLLHHPEAELVAVCDKYTPLLDLARQNAENAGLHIACFESFDDFIRYDMDRACYLCHSLPEGGQACAV